MARDKINYDLKKSRSWVNLAKNYLGAEFSQTDFQSINEEIWYAPRFGLYMLMMWDKGQ